MLLILVILMWLLQKEAKGGVFMTVVEKYIKQMEKLTEMELICIYADLLKQKKYNYWCTRLIKEELAERRKNAKKNY